MLRVIAICNALEEDRKSTNHKTTYIFVDSQAALKRIMKGAGEFSQRTWHLAEGRRVYLHWCPSHVNIPGNEMADKLAKDGLDMETADRFATYTIHSHLKGRIKSKALENWKAKWFKDNEDREKGQPITGLGTTYRKIAQDLLPFSHKPKWPS
jgi:hypothetical protein